MSKIVNYAILIVLCCSCGTQKIALTRNPIIVPRPPYEVKPIELKEVKFEIIEKDNKVCLTKENLINDIDNLNKIRRAYNELILIYQADLEYYQNATQVFNK